MTRQILKGYKEHRHMQTLPNYIQRVNRCIEYDINNFKIDHLIFIRVRLENLCNILTSEGVYKRQILTSIQENFKYSIVGDCWFLFSVSKTCIKTKNEYININALSVSLSLSLSLPPPTRMPTFMYTRQYWNVLPTMKGSTESYETYTPFHIFIQQFYTLCLSYLIFL